MVTSFLRGDHKSLGRLAPPLPRLRRDPENVDGLRLEVRHRVLSSAGVQHVHYGCVAVGGVEVVCDLVGWRQKKQKMVTEVSFDAQLQIKSRLKNVF